MAPCGNCGLAGPDDARFCSRCGTGLGGAGLELRAVGTLISSESNLTRNQGNRLWPVVALGLGLLGLLWWPSTTAPAAELPVQTIRPTTTRSADQAALGPPTAAPLSPVTTESPLSPRPTPTVVEVASTTVATTVIGAGGPLLGQPSGLSLLIGDLAGLQRVDLDTGVVTSFDVRGWPVRVAGSWLVVAEPDRLSVRAVPLATPEVNSQLLGYSATPGVVAAGPQSAQVWFLALEAEPTWRLVDLDTGTTLDEVATTEGGGFVTNDPAVASSAAGGVFTNVVGPVGRGRSGDGAIDYGSYRKVFDGRPVAVSDDLVLVQTCSRATQCRLQWLDRATWQVIDRPAPEGRSYWSGWLSPGGRVLTYYRDDVGAQIFDVERGSLIDLAVASPQQVSVSSDGRYLAAATVDSYVIYDRQTDHRYPIDLGRPGDHRLLLVANG
jgi:hypothetical protein